MSEPKIDWSKFDRYQKNTCSCRCGNVFRSHSKLDMFIKKPITRYPCPGCGRNDNCYSIKSDPEVYGMSDDDIKTIGDDG